MLYKLRPKRLVGVRGKGDGGRWTVFQYVPGLDGMTYPLRLLKIFRIFPGALRECGRWWGWREADGGKMY